MNAINLKIEQKDVLSQAEMSAVITLLSGWIIREISKETKFFEAV